MIKPDFLVIGAMKCASSTICAFLEDHPDVYITPNAEPNFFSHDSNWEKGEQWYEQFFFDKTDEILCGEGSNNYTCSALYPECAERISFFCPDVKLIYSVRHPIERIVSTWIQKRADSGDKVPYSLDKAIEEMPSHFIDPSLYWRQIEAYRKFFPDNQIWIGFMEDLFSEPNVFFSELCSFLDIPMVESIQRKHVNVSTGKVIPNKRYSAVQKVPGFKIVKGLVPKAIKENLRSKFFSTEIKNKPSFVAKSIELLNESLREDTEKFLDYVGKPKDYWKFV